MDERVRHDRDGNMWHGNGQFSHRQLAGAMVALAALVAGPLAIPAATALPAAASAESRSSYAVGSVAETPSQAALRTSGTLAGIVIGTASLVALWWLLVMRNRRRD